MEAASQPWSAQPTNNPAPTNNSSYIGRVISFYFVFVFVFVRLGSLIMSWETSHTLSQCNIFAGFWLCGYEFDFELTELKATIGF